MMRQARVLECVRVHVDAVIVFVFMLVLVNVFVNMVVNVNVFMLMFSNVFVNTIVNVAMFMLVLVKVFANVSISLIQLHIYIYIICIDCILPLQNAVTIQQPTDAMPRDAPRQMQNAMHRILNAKKQQNASLIEPFRASQGLMGLMRH